jgi:uncharacterized protein YcbK (DUF882 family)
MSKPSKDFEYSEFVVSAEHPELAKQITLSDTDKLKIALICLMNLQPVREKLGMPVVILSGKRSPELNKLIGGADASDHLYENDTAAVDFTVPGASMFAIWHGLILNPRTFGQCIYYPKQNFIHISLPSQKHCGEYWEKH